MDTRKTGLLKRGLQLEYLTLGWNVVGVVVILLAALAARSVALAGFGLDFVNRDVRINRCSVAVDWGR